MINILLSLILQIFKIFKIDQKLDFIRSSTSHKIPIFCKRVAARVMCHAISVMFGNPLSKKSRNNGELESKPCALCSFFLITLGPSKLDVGEFLPRRFTIDSFVCASSPASSTTTKTQILEGGGKISARRRAVVRCPLPCISVHLP